MNVAGRKMTDYAGNTFNTLVVKRVASPLEIRNWLGRSVNPAEAHKYWYCVCQAPGCGRTVILRSDVVKNATKRCLCSGGHRTFRGADNDLKG